MERRASKRRTTNTTEQPAPKRQRTSSSSHRPIEDSETSVSLRSSRSSHDLRPRPQPSSRARSPVSRPISSSSSVSSTSESSSSSRPRRVARRVQRTASTPAAAPITSPTPNTNTEPAETEFAVPTRRSRSSRNPPQPTTTPRRSRTQPALTTSRRGSLQPSSNVIDLTGDDDEPPDEIESYLTGFWGFTDDEEDDDWFEGDELDYGFDEEEDDDYGLDENHLATNLPDLERNPFFHTLTLTQRRSIQSLFALPMPIPQPPPPRGATTQEIQSLNKAKLSADSEDCCCICLDDMKKNQMVRHLKCVHYFHVNCIAKWLKQSSVCPVCKMSVLG